LLKIQCGGLLGEFRRLFIEMLLKANHDEIRDLYNKTRYALRNKYTDNLESHLDAVACVSVADYLISQWIFAEGKDAAVVGAATMSDHIINELVSESESDEMVVVVYKYIHILRKVRQVRQNA
jgi:hypothetical protein